MGTSCLSTIFPISYFLVSSEQDVSYTKSFSAASNPSAFCFSPAQVELLDIVDDLEMDQYLVFIVSPCEVWLAHLMLSEVSGVIISDWREPALLFLSKESCRVVLMVDIRFFIRTSWPTFSSHTDFNFKVLPCQFWKDQELH